MKRFAIAVLTLAMSAFLAACAEQGNYNNAGNKAANGANNSANSAKPAADSAAVEAEVRKFVTDFEAALNKNDADALGKFYADDYIVIDPNGIVQTRASRLEQIKSGKLKWEGIKYSDVKVRTHPAGDGAVIYGRVSGKATVDGTSGDRNSMVTLVARKSADGWKFIHAQITDIKPGSSTPTEVKPAAANSTPANK